MLQDPHSKVFNFVPELQNIPPVDDFDFGRLTPFTTSSKHSVSNTTSSVGLTLDLERYSIEGTASNSEGTYTRFCWFNIVIDRPTIPNLFFDFWRQTGEHEVIWSSICERG